MRYKILTFFLFVSLVSCANIKQEKSTQWYDDPLLIEQSQTLLQALPDGIPHEFLLDANAPKKVVRDHLYLLPCYIDSMRLIASHGSEWERWYTAKDIKCKPLPGPWVATYTLLYASIDDEEPRYYSVPTLLRPEMLSAAKRVLSLVPQPILIENEYDQPIYMAIQLE